MPYLQEVNWRLFCCNINPCNPPRTSIWQPLTNFCPAAKQQSRMINNPSMSFQNNRSLSQSKYMTCVKAAGLLMAHCTLHSWCYIHSIKRRGPRLLICFWFVHIFKARIHMTHKQIIKIWLKMPSKTQKSTGSNTVLCLSFKINPLTLSRI